MGSADETRHNTISHDLPRNRVNHTPIAGVNGAISNMMDSGTPTHGGGSLGGNPGMTTFSGGFTHNPLSRRGTGNGGFLNQTADGDPRNLRATGYSKEDVQEARDGLKLLKRNLTKKA